MAADPTSFYPELRFGGYTRFDGTIAFYQRIQALAQDAACVVDVGCGPHDPSKTEDPVPLRKRLRELGGEGRRVIGIDVEQAGESNPFIDEFRLIDEHGRWPIDDASADVVVSDFVLEHLDQPDAFFAEAARVLKPGGFFCARTPNRWHYVPLLATLIPDRWHDRLIRRAQPEREHAYPTRYRCNTRGALRRLMRRHGMDGTVLVMEGEPAYLKFSTLAYALGVLYQRWAPACVCSTLFAYARKRE